MSTEGMLQKQMLEGSIQDLSVSKNLKEEVGTYYPAVRNALETSAGLLMAIPLSMEINLWDYHADQWEALQLPNLPKTVDELIAVNDLWNAQYAEKHLLEFSDEWDRNPKRLFYAACYQYALEEATDTEPTDFNTPKFRQLATKFLSLPKRKFVYQDNSIVRCMGNSEFDPMRYRSLSYMGVNGYSPMIPPAITDAPTKIGARMNVQCLSAEAPNPELALAYLEFVMRHLPEEVTMMLSPENSMPLLISDPEALKAVVEYDTKEISSLLYHYNGEWEYAYWKESWMHAMEYFLQSIKESPYVISSSSLSLYQNIVPQLTFYTDAPPIYTYRWQDEESESLIIERLIMQLNEYSH